jgi:PucR C-terminal helix-turn-helix domain/GGDEF-like domain
VTLGRLRNLAEPVGESDPLYVAALRAALSATLHHLLESIERAPDFTAPIPSAAANQTRWAMREGVRLDTVLRGYTSGNKVLEEFLFEEAEDIPSRMLSQILHDLGPVVDRLLESVAAEYRDEGEHAGRSSSQRRADQILTLLHSHETVGLPDLAYDFDLWHVGLICTGRGADMATRAVAERFGCSLLQVARDEQTEWAWLGARSAPDVGKVVAYLRDRTADGVSSAIGEPRQGVGGWRQSFREARAALQVMVYRPQKVARCRDVILESAVLRADSLSSALIETYLAPLDGRGDAGEILRKTLRAYLGAGRNAATAAVALGVARNTVERRLRTVEQKLDQPLDTCSAQLQIALRVEELLNARDGLTAQVS